MNFITNATKYFLSVLSTQSHPDIDFKKKTFFTAEYEDVIKGKIDPKIYNKLSNNKNKSYPINVILSLKTLRTEYFETNQIKDIEELTGVLFVPAVLSYTGKLSVPKSINPWIPRDCLSPIAENKISIGKSSDVDMFLETHVSDKNQINQDWIKYILYSEDMFSYVVGNQNFDNKKNAETEINGNVYVFMDDTVNTTMHIKKLYANILDNLSNISIPLYDRIINGTNDNYYISDELSVHEMKRHCGQMNGEYPLSPSQREVINQFNKLQNGDILAVNGPPGTGKTTVLQTIVADVIIKKAMENSDIPPIIVGTSANNQAVTNIIDSFSKVNGILNNTNLEERWITGVDGLGVYFPSKVNTKNNYQYSTNSGDYLLEYNEKESNIASSKERMLTSCTNYFQTSQFYSIDECKKALHDELITINGLKCDYIDFVNDINTKLDGKTFEDSINTLKNEILLENEKLAILNNTLNDLKMKRSNLCKRVNEWSETYMIKTSLITRIFSFIPANHKKIVNWININKNSDEIQLLQNAFSLSAVTNKYCEEINKLDNEINSELNNQSSIKNNITNLQNELTNWNKISECYNEFIKKFQKHKIDLQTNIYSIEKTNDIIDKKIRYVMFWLAVHYYECQWLLESHAHNNLTFKNNLIERYQKLAMITPCFVMTFYQLPKNFRYSNSNYLYNFIDLLIVDEAGQISPEIACASFALAKKAIVVGDENQIPPVWSTEHYIDYTLAKESGVVEHKQEFENISQRGLNCSSSSLMKLANYACKFNKIEKTPRGLFLSEHRRCYDEIIGYCNELIYNRNLEPKKGKYNDSDTPYKDQLPPMGYYKIDTVSSQVVGTSRKNENEAKEIAKWLKNNFDKLYDTINKNTEKTVKPENIIGIITPFKSQENCIKQSIKSLNDDRLKQIKVGTVHTFQGAECSIIIFSTVYGSSDGCYFINKNKDLINVAVSRAKNNFLVFGSMKCLEQGSTSPSQLLYNRLENINKED